MTTGPTLRTTVVVRDIDASLELFRDILGLKVRVDLPLSGEAVGTLLGLPGVEGRIVILQSGDHMTGNVALMAYTNRETSPVPVPEAKLDVGDVVVVMETTAIDEIVQTVKDKGYTVLSEPLVIFPQENMVEQTREVIFFGPDGLAVNLIQRGVPADQ